MKDISTMTRKEILAVKPRDDWMKPVMCRGFILIPTRRKHDSGYKQMEIVAVDSSNYPICKCSASYDVINLIKYDRYNKIVKTPIPENEATYRWHIDCLPKCGLLYFSTWDEHQTEICADSSSIDIKGFVSQENI